MESQLYIKKKPRTYNFWPGVQGGLDGGNLDPAQ